MRKRAPVRPIEELTLEEAQRRLFLRLYQRELREKKKQQLAESTPKRVELPIGTHKSRYVWVIRVSPDVIHISPPVGHQSFVSSLGRLLAQLTSDGVIDQQRADQELQLASEYIKGAALTTPGFAKEAVVYEKDPRSVLLEFIPVDQRNLPVKKKRKPYGKDMDPEAERQLLAERRLIHRAYQDAYREKKRAERLANK